MNCFSEIFFSTLSQQKLMRKKFLVKQKYLLILKNKNKMKNLQEMSLNEMKRTEGGFAWWWTLLGENSTNFWTIDMFGDGKIDKKQFYS